MSFPARIVNVLEGRAVALQAIRFAFAGTIITILFSAAYWAVADLLGVDPMLSLMATFVFFTGVSYVTHGAFSFRGHGERDRHHVRASRFLIVNLLALLLNQFFVWLLVKRLGGPTWWPIIPFIFVTPWMSFFLNRRWVYG